MDPQKPRLLMFLHLPKTGGSTLLQILRKQFAALEIFAVRGDGIDASKRQLEAYRLEDRAPLKLVMGHMTYGWHQFFPDHQVTYFTMLREPIDRVISHYYYVRRSKNHYLNPGVTRNDMSLVEYIESGICDEVNNGQTRLLSGEEEIVQKPYGESKIPYGSNDTSLLKQARENLGKGFELVGCQEHFDDSLLLMKHHFGFRHLAYQPQNVTTDRPHPSELDARTLRVIRSYNELDVQLYEESERLFQQQLASMGIGLNVQRTSLRARKLAQRGLEPLGRRSDRIGKLLERL